MNITTYRRATALAIAAVLTSAVGAFADTVPADGDPVAGNQTIIDLGQRVVGDQVDWNVMFNLTCAGQTHALADETITIDLPADGVNAPLDGAVVATSTTIGPVPTSWPIGTDGCPSPAPRLASNGPSVVTLTMPTTPGIDYRFSLMYSRTDETGLTNVSAITFIVDAVPNTPPTLTLPSPLIVEGNTTGGATVSYTVGATDAEDNPDPTPSCSPASGTFFALGTHTVDCSVTDHHGAKTTGSFDVTVVDTTAPTMAGVPGDQSVTTSNPSGIAVSYGTPTATDVVDSNPSVSCLPASGSTFAVGTTNVTCTATDASGNPRTASFKVTVVYDPGVVWSAVWSEPVGSGAVLATNQSRTVPVKVQIFANGVEQTSGRAVLRVDACGGGFSTTTPLTWGGGRWSGHLDTSTLPAGCFTATAVLDGHDAGSFRLDVRGAESLSAPAKAKAKGPKG
jgi:hypothetical protein